MFNFFLNYIVIFGIESVNHTKNYQTNRICYPE